MACTNPTLDSNATGLRFAVEACLGVLPGEVDELDGLQPGVPTWHELEPNSYNDFGGELTTVARSPIKAGRQKERGVVTDLSANAQFQMDFTLDNYYRLMPSFFYSSWRNNFVSEQINGVDGTTEDFDGENEFATSDWPVGTLVYAQGFSNAINNGLHTVDSANVNSLGVSTNLVAEAGAAQTLANFTWTVTIDADMDNGYAADVVASYTAIEGDDLNEVAAGLSAALTAAGVANTVLADVVTITGATEDTGQSVITAAVTRDGHTYASMAVVVEAAGGMTTDDRDLDLNGVSAPTVIEGAKVWRVGVVGASADFRIDASVSGAPALTSELAGLDFTTLGITPGQWMYLGGDTSALAFATAANNGFARVVSVAAHRIVFDKTQNTMVTDAGTGKTVQIFYGPFIHNEPLTENIVRTSLQFERSLAGAGYEYVEGAVGNQLALNIQTADKITADLEFVGTDAYDEEAVDRKGGFRPLLDTASQGFNTSSDFTRIRLAEDATLQTPLFAFVTDMTLTINNNVTALKALGKLGSIGASAGDFEVTGNVTAYFSNVAAAQAVRDNAAVTFDFAMVAGNRGWIFDIPGITLGDAKKAVEKDRPITLPLSMAAWRHPTLNYTLGACFFPYLPDRAG